LLEALDAIAACGMISAAISSIDSMKRPRLFATFLLAALLLFFLFILSPHIFLTRATAHRVVRPVPHIIIYPLSVRYKHKNITFLWRKWIASSLRSSQ
jgi:hypothetical protein